jgi:hypothetical protein
MSIVLLLNLFAFIFKPTIYSNMLYIITSLIFFIPSFILIISFYRQYEDIRITKRYNIRLSLCDYFSGVLLVASGLIWAFDYIQNLAVQTFLLIVDVALTTYQVGCSIPLQRQTDLFCLKIVYLWETETSIRTLELSFDIARLQTATSRKDDEARHYGYRRVP